MAVLKRDNKETQTGGLFDASCSSRRGSVREK